MARRKAKSVRNGICEQIERNLESSGATFTVSVDYEPKLPNYPLALEPVTGLSPALAGILDGIYKTSDAGEAVTLVSSDGWIICGVVFEGAVPGTWVLGSLKDQG